MASWGLLLKEHRTPRPPLMKWDKGRPLRSAGRRGGGTSCRNVWWGVLRTPTERCALEMRPPWRSAPWPPRRSTSPALVTCRRQNIPVSHHAITSSFTCTIADGLCSEITAALWCIYGTVNFESDLHSLPLYLIEHPLMAGCNTIKEPGLVP